LTGCGSEESAALEAKKQRFWMLGSGYWMLDARYWMLDTGFWMLDAGYWMLHTGFWMLDAGYQKNGVYAVRYKV
jgi:hypothetical protein